MNPTMWLCDQGEMAERIRTHDWAPALHELAAVARCRGVVSADGRLLLITWKVADQRRGVPCPSPSGIEERPVCVASRLKPLDCGRELIERALPHSLNAETRYELDETGLRCTICLPLTREGLKERGA